MSRPRPGVPPPRWRLLTQTCPLLYSLLGILKNMSSPVSIDIKEGNGAFLGGGPGGHRRLDALWGSLERCEGGAEGPVALKVEYAKR